MAENNVKDFRPNDIAYFNGKQVRILAAKDGHVEIIDQSGRTYSVNIEALKKGCIWNFDFVDPDIVAQYDQKIEECEIAENNAKKYLKACKDSIRQLFNSFGTRIESELSEAQLAQLDAAKEKKCIASQDKVACSNRTRSTLISKFIYVT